MPSPLCQTSESPSRAMKFVSDAAAKMDFAALAGSPAAVSSLPSPLPLTNNVPSESTETSSGQKSSGNA